MAGSTFKAQKILAEGIMSESPQLIEAIISNPELRRIAEEFWKDMGRMLTSIQDTKIEEIVTYINACKERLGTNSNVATSKKKMAKAAKSIAILGAGGSMGTWFSKYFIALKYSVTGFDSENAIKVKGVIWLPFFS